MTKQGGVRITSSITITKSLIMKSKPFKRIKTFARQLTRKDAPFHNPKEKLWFKNCVKTNINMG